MTEVTQILSQLGQGDTSAADALLPTVYDELRRLAGAKLANEKPGQTLQPTALVHEAYVKLVNREQGDWQSRRHFYAAASEAMRHILIDNARRKLRQKRGGGESRSRVPTELIEAPNPTEELLALNEALEQLEVEDSQKAELVKLRYFAGLSMEEAAETLGISRTTAHRYWTYARAWLFRKLSAEQKVF